MCGYAAVTMLSMSVCASAESGIDASAVLTEAVLSAEPDVEGYMLASKDEVALEDGLAAEVETYLEDGVETYLQSSSGHSDYMCKADFKYDGKTVIKLWVKGTFYWNNSSDERAYVINDDGGYTIVNGSYKYISKEYKTGDDVGGLFGGKRYSYVEQSLTILDTLNHRCTYTLSFDVNVDGEYHYKTSGGNADVNVS